MTQASVSPIKLDHTHRIRWIRGQDGAMPVKQHLPPHRQTRRGTWVFSPITVAHVCLLAFPPAWRAHQCSLDSAGWAAVARGRILQPFPWPSLWRAWPVPGAPRGCVTCSCPQVASAFSNAPSLKSPRFGGRVGRTPFAKVSGTQPVSDFQRKYMPSPGISSCFLFSFFFFTFSMSSVKGVRQHGGW